MKKQLCEYARKIVGRSFLHKCTYEDKCTYQREYSKTKQSFTCATGLRARELGIGACDYETIRRLNNGTR